MCLLYAGTSEVCAVSPPDTVIRSFLSVAMLWHVCGTSVMSRLAPFGAHWQTLQKGTHRAGSTNDWFLFPPVHFITATRFQCGAAK
jgi:hypothetical protein